MLTYKEKEFTDTEFIDIVSRATDTLRQVKNVDWKLVRISTSSDDYSRLSIIAKYNGRRTKFVFYWPKLLDNKPYIKNNIFTKDTSEKLSTKDLFILKIAYYMYNITKILDTFSSTELEDKQIYETSIVDNDDSSVMVKVYFDV